MKLHEITDNTPLLVAIIHGLPKDAKIFYQRPMAGGGYFLHKLHGVFMEPAQQVRITYVSSTTYSSSTPATRRLADFNVSFEVDADTFDEHFRLAKKKNNEGEDVWILHYSTSEAMDV